MPTIIDSLFLELGIDTSKFSKDQQRALTKISEFEKRSKKGAKGAAQSVKTVGEAFRDIADDSSIGGATKRLDSFSTKLKALGQAGQVSGGLGTPLGKMAEGLGALLSPAALGVAAFALLGKGAWDLNEKMTATNATIDRQAKLSGMNARNMWAWGEAARTVGGSPSGVRGGIASLQTSILGGMIGAGMPTQQLVGLARLGVRWNAQTGVDIKSLFQRVHAMGQTQGWARTFALVSQYGLMNEDEFNLAMTKSAGLAAVDYAKHAAPVTLGETLRKSLQSQSILGKLGIQKDVLAETAYGGIQGPMAALVTLMTSLLDAINSMLAWTIKIAGYIDNGVAGALAKLIEFFTGRKATSGMSALIGGVPLAGKLPSSFAGRQEMAMKALMGRGMSQLDAAAVVGNMSQESSLNPTSTSDNGAHIGLGQLDKSRQKRFARMFGYQIGSTAIPQRQQFLQELMFAQLELFSSQRLAARKMAAAADLYDKTQAFQDYDERPGANDKTFGRRLLYAQSALEMGMSYQRMLSAANARRGVIDRSVTHHTRIGTVAVHTQATDAKGMAAGARKALSTHPLLGPQAQHQVTLSTRGMTG